MQYLLDTSICVFFLRGKLNLDAIVREKGRENFAISEIKVAELRYGAENSLNPGKAHQSLDAFISGLTVVPIFGSIPLYAKEKVRLRRMGKPINDEFDLLIGVTAIQNEMVLVTDNERDFMLLEGVRMENWYPR